MRFQLFVADALARKRYWARSMLGWRTMAQARPTAAHQALVQLESAGRIELFKTSRDQRDDEVTLDAICEALACQPGDILRFEPEDEATTDSLPQAAERR